MKNTLGNTLKDLPLAHKIVAAAAVAILGLAAFAFIQWAGTPSYSVLFTDLDDAHLSQVIGQLEADNVPYKLEGGGSRILVPKSAVYKERASMASAGIQGSVVPQGYELLDNQGLSVSDFRQRVDYQRALEGEMSRTLMAMDPINFATVHLVIPEESLFAENQQPVTASVLVSTDRDLNQSEVETITFVISSAVEGLEPGNVTVADVGGHVLNAAGEDATAGSIGSRQLRMTREFEAALAGDVNALLTTIAGPNRASVVVRAVLDFDEHTTESEQYDKDSATALKEQVIDESFNGTGQVPEGTVGVDGQPLPVDSNGDYTYQRNETTREYGIDRTVVHSVKAPGKVERLSVAVVADDGTLTGAAVPTKDEISKLVAAALALDPERGDTIEVATVPFPADETAEAVPPEAADASTMTDMIPQAGGALVLVIVAIGLLLLSRTGSKDTKKRGKKGAEPDVPELASPEGGDRPRIPVAAGARSLQSDVMELVERQPDEIATLLRSWLADRRS